MNIRQSLPSAVSSSCIATSEPSASPSGFSCVTTISLLGRPQLLQHRGRGSAVASSSVVMLASSADLLGSISCGDPHPAVDRVVVVERQRGRVLERQLGGDPRPEESRGRSADPRGWPRERRRRRARSRRRGRGAGRAGLDSGHGHESHAGSFRSLAIASLSTALTASSTRRIRPVPSYPPRCSRSVTITSRRSSDRGDDPLHSARPLGSGRQPALDAVGGVASMGSEPLVSAAVSVARCHRS